MANKQSLAAKRRWLSMDEDQRQEWLESQRQGMKAYWAGISKEERLARARKIAESRKRNRKAKANGKA